MDRELFSSEMEKLLMLRLESAIELVVTRAKVQAHKDMMGIVDVSEVNEAVKAILDYTHNFYRSAMGDQC
jgi:hypothetical protein